MRLISFRELDVYQLAFKTANEIYLLSKNFPPEEKYSLTDQIRRSSRSVCANLAEAWRKRKYRDAFIAKLSDVEAECSETQVWLDFSLAHAYITQEIFNKLDDQLEHVSAMLINMARNHESWTVPK